MKRRLTGSEFYARRREYNDRRASALEKARERAANYLNSKIEVATETWKDVDTDEFMDELRSTDGEKKWREEMGSERTKQILSIITDIEKIIDDEWVSLECGQGETVELNHNDLKSLTEELRQANERLAEMQEAIRCVIIDTDLQPHGRILYETKRELEKLLPDPYKEPTK